MTTEVPAGGSDLHVVRFGAGRGTVLAVHGITSCAMAFGAVARRLPPGWTMLAPDLRGRGRSAGLPGPYGLARHAADVCAVAQRQDRPVVLAGHSMGAFVALLAAAARPELFRRLVLVDGGLPLPALEGVDPDQRLAATLGPAISRLSQTFQDERAYLDFFRAHPALGPHWNPDIEAYVAYDLTGPAGAMRSRVRAEAVRQDGRELLAGAADFAAALRSLIPGSQIPGSQMPGSQMPGSQIPGSLLPPASPTGPGAPVLPVLVLTAPDGMFGHPPGFMPPPLVRQWCAELPGLRAELVGDCNHYTILLAPHAAALVAARLTDPATWP